MQTEKELKLAVLIDADNTSVRSLAAIMDEITKYGVPIVKHAYGDWSKSELAGWKETLLEVAVVPRQQYSYTSGKNATDIAMVIEAMDILHDGSADGFVLVSSDSDFTPLALRLRESGKRVFGIGGKKTPQPFIKACDKFIFIEILDGNDSGLAVPSAPASNLKTETAPSPASPQTSTPTAPQAKAGSGETEEQQKGKPKPVTKADVIFLAKCIAEGAGDSPECLLSALGNLINKKRPEFDSRNYGYSRLSKLLRSIDRFAVKGEGANMSVSDTKAHL
jgi:hypothetical protein